MNIIQSRPRIEPFGPASAGMSMSPPEFDRTEFVEGWRYQLIHGVLVVTPMPLNNERDPNEELGHLFRDYRDHHPLGTALDYTVYETTIRTGRNRRRADRAVWAGLGRRPRKKETPTIAIEFTSRRKRDRERDYVVKRDEYMTAGVKEYWVIDRFEHTMTVFTRARNKNRSKVLGKDRTYTTELLPGFELSLARLFELANRWDDDQPE